MRRRGGEASGEELRVGALWLWVRKLSRDLLVRTCLLYQYKSTNTDPEEQVKLCMTA